MRIGIMSAMLEENRLLISRMSGAQNFECAGRVYTKGRYLEHDLVVAFSRWGKTASAVTASHLINTFHIDKLIFTGVAGSATPQLKVGDIVVADRLIHHDMDARPLYERFEVPLIKETYFETDRTLHTKMLSACAKFLKDRHSYIKNEELLNFDISSPMIHTGLIASGDKFFSSKSELKALKTLLPETLCVEMEGASVAQVCKEHNIPFAIVRTISDNADESSSINFLKFIEKIASVYSLGIIEQLLDL